MPTIRTPTGRDFLDAMRETEDDFSRACFLIFRCAYAGEERAFASVSPRDSLRPQVLSVLVAMLMTTV